MTYKRFPPEGYIQKTLFYAFLCFIWPVFGMKSHEKPVVDDLTFSESIHLCPKDSSALKCYHCSEVADVVHVTVGISRRSYCVEHLNTIQLERN